MPCVRTPKDPMCVAVSEDTKEMGDNVQVMNFFFFCNLVYQLVLDFY